MNLPNRSGVGSLGIANPTAAVQCRNVSKSFHRGSEHFSPIDGANIDIAPGEMVALMGRSGSGKSTFLNLVAGLVDCDDGVICVDGQRVDMMTRSQLSHLRLHRIGIVFQRFNLIPVLTVRENVELPHSLSGGNRRTCRSEELLARVGLTKQADQYPKHLSGGEMQRVAVARALINNPPVILADEPTGNLDRSSAEKVLNVLRFAVAEQGAALLLVTHDREAAGICSRVLSLHEGKIGPESR